MKPSLVELVDQGLESLLGVCLADRVLERLPVGVLDAFALSFGELGVEVARAVGAAASPIRGRPALLDRLDQPGGAVGHYEHRCRKPSGDQVAPERLPVLVGLAHPEHHREQHALAAFGESPGNEDALLGPTATHGDERGIEEHGHQPGVIDASALERLKALPQLLTDPRRGRLRELAQPSLLAQ